ncbi:MAG TPA: heme lyase CcmF/NrfE family subunit [Thermoanaerobaculia bacterium]|nr:heme lyase CcmF/NrfE family subunit [Thermoanaerobaculia bacterium]
MIAPLGRILILASLLVSAAGAVVGFAAGRTRSREGLKWAQRFAYAFAFLMIAATAVMEYALLTHDFSVSYVAQVGSRATPMWVTIASLWSSLEGSILFWGCVLGIYVAIATFMTRNDYKEYMPDAIGVWLSCATFFSFLIAGPANPFLTVPQPPLDGPGPNPLLQNHILMVVHPPFLYLGYVGMTIPFGLACAALIKGRLGLSFLKPIREALMVPWVFLTFAIMLGGWWAYEVLGWGGYWAWDPVENASLLPWLTATAAIHSIVVLERRGVLKGWTVTLIQATFLLVILGTFMTRSGVFNSVHSFTQSAIGPTILAFLTAALIFSVALLAMRIDLLEAEGRFESAASREGMFLFNNLLFVVLTFTVLIGTVFPLIVEAVRGKQMSVGRPYFDSMVVPIGAALLFLLGVGPALPWGRATLKQIRKALLPPLIGAAVLVVAGYLFGVRNGWTILTLAFGGYAAQVTFTQMRSPVTQIKRARRRISGYIVHAGAVIVILAIAISSTMRYTQEVHFPRIGSSVTVGSYVITLLGIEERQEPNRTATVARIAVAKNGVQKTILEPRMNQYMAMREPIGTPDVYSTIGGDFYLSVMNIDPATQSVALNAIVTPFVGWIWSAVVLMGLGGLSALIPQRKLAVERQPSSAADDSLEVVAG